MKTSRIQLTERRSLIDKVIVWLMGISDKDIKEADKKLRQISLNALNDIHWEMSKPIPKYSGIQKKFSPIIKKHIEDAKKHAKKFNYTLNIDK